MMGWSRQTTVVTWSQQCEEINGQIKIYLVEINSTVSLGIGRVRRDENSL